MTIPDSVQLMGKPISVIQNNKGVRKRNNYGEANFNNLTIKIADTIHKKPILQSQAEHTFFHELVHQCLWVMQEHKLNDNEKFVDMLGGLLHQALAPHMK